jgi:hypothetical protein
MAPTDRPPIAPGLLDSIRAAFASAGVAPGAMVRSALLAPSPRLATPGQRAALDDNGDFRWILTTEQPATVFDWDQYDFVDEVLLMDGLILPASRQVPLLDSHNRSSVDDHIGSVRDFSNLVAGGFTAIDGAVRFAADEKSQRTAQKVLDGHITDGSVGYLVNKSIWIPEGTEVAIRGRMFRGPLKVSHEWSLKEFSITPIGADTLAKVRSLCVAGGRLATPRNR